MRKSMKAVMNVLAAVMVFSLMFVIPSGAVTEDAEMAYYDALYEETEGDYAVE